MKTPVRVAKSFDYRENDRFRLFGDIFKKTNSSFSNEKA